jgi:hypothetical protein
MLPIITLTSAWLERLGWSHSEAAEFLLNLVPADALPARVGDVCPRCGRHHAEMEGRILMPDPTTSTPKHVKGRAFVLCLCGTMYWFAAVHDVDVNQPIGQASVRADSTTRTPVTGTIQTQGIQPVVVENVSSTETVAVHITPEPGLGEQSPRISTPPPDPPVSQCIGSWYRLPWYGRYAREASRVFAAAVGIAVFSLIVVVYAALTPPPPYTIDALPLHIRSFASPAQYMGLPVAGAAQVNTVTPPWSRQGVSPP